MYNEKIKTIIRYKELPFESDLQHVRFNLQVFILGKCFESKIELHKSMILNITRKSSLSEYFLNVARQRFIDSLQFEIEEE